MKTFIGILFVCAIAVAQQTSRQAKPRPSPHATTGIELAGKKITIEYGRPFMRGRKIFGGLVPYDQVWRTGADEATKLTTDADLVIGGLDVPAGSYSLFTIPTQGTWKLIVNKVANQWGAFKYDPKQDLGRVDMKVEHLSVPIEQFTISVGKTGPQSGVITMSWENTAASVPFVIK